MIRTAVYVMLLSCLVLLLSGCYSTEEIRTYGELTEAYFRPLRIMTVDTTIYDLSSCSFNDTVLAGEGEHLVAGRWTHFSGNLPMSRIVYIQTRTLNIPQTLIGLGLSAFAALVADQGLGGRGLSVYREMGGDGLIGGSCPYVYAWNGTRFIRDGEVFGTALGKGLETSTACLLPDETTGEGVVRVRITDERPETHYINSVSVCANYVPLGNTVALDTRDRAWPLFSLQPSLRAPAEIVKRDTVRWKSSTPRPAGKYRDTLEILLPVTPGAREGSLVVHAINTHRSEAAFQTLFGFLGDASLPYLYRMEHDTGTIALLRGWLEECSLHIDVQAGEGWVNAGKIPPEANEVPFTRLVRIPAPAAAGDTLRLRLRVLSDTWEIDDIAVDWSPAVPLEEQMLPLLSATKSDARSVERSLRSSDSDYVRLLPGESVDLTFSPAPPRVGYSVTYACHAAGYLYEWFTDQPAPVYDAETFLAPPPDRLAAADWLLRNHDAFLSLLFDGQRKVSR